MELPLNVTHRGRRNGDNLFVAKMEAAETTVGVGGGMAREEYIEGMRAFVVWFWVARNPI